MRNSDDAFLMILAALVALSLAMSTCDGSGLSVALSQDSGPRISAHEALWLACVHEASVPSPVDEDGDGSVDLWVRPHVDERVWNDILVPQTEDGRYEWGADCWLIHEVFLRGAERMLEERPTWSWERRYVAYAARYSERSFRPGPEVGNWWTPWFTLAPYAEDPPLRAPPNWPAGAPRWGWLEARMAYAWTYTMDVIGATLEDADDWSLCAEPVDDWGGRMDHEHARAIGLIEVDCGPTANTGYARPSQIRARTPTPAP